ncbi:MAG: MerR family transcriptional regulator [Pseudomonadota bacterium]
MPKRPTKPRETPGLRMKDLAEACGLPKSTLLYYVEQGLLPQPVRTSANMAYYSPDCVQRAAFIKELQVSHRLPLEKIRTLLELKDQGQEVTPLVEMLNIIYGQPPERLLNLREFCRRTGLTPEDVAQWREAGLLLPMNEKGFDSQDLAIGQVLAQGQKQGMRPRDLGYYHRFGREIVKREIALRQRLTAGLAVGDNARRSMTMVQAARAMRSYVIDRIFQQQVRDSRFREEE